MDKQPPSKHDVEWKLAALIDGTISRSEAHDWAIQYMLGAWDDVNFHPAVWEAIGRLASADAISTDRPHLYDEIDFRAWLDELRGAK